MIKVMVVLYGLVMFVPQDGGLLVLFVDDGAHGSAGHTPTLRAVLEDGKLGDAWSLPPGFDWSFVLRGQEGLVEQTPVAQVELGEVGDASQYDDVDLGGLNDFVQLEDLFTYKHRGMVRKDCVKDHESCRELVRGRLRFKGEWSTRPATHCKGDWSPPIEFDDIMRFQFWRPFGGMKQGMRTRRLGTALRLDSTLLENWNGDALQELMLSAELLDRTVLSNDKCKKWMGEDVDKCIILLIGNHLPVQEDSSEPTYRDEDRRLDKHFAAFYRLTTDPPWKMNQLLPYIYTELKCPPGYPTYNLYNKPAPLCPPAFATAQN